MMVIQWKHPNVHKRTLSFSKLLMIYKSNTRFVRFGEKVDASTVHFFSINK